MSLFHKILSGISEKINSFQSIKQDIALDISDIVGVSIKENQFQIKNNKVFFLVSPTIKSVIYLKQDKILEKLKRFNITSIG